MQLCKCLYGVEHMICGLWLKSVKCLNVKFKFVLITFHDMSKCDHYWTGACSLFYNLFLSWSALADVCLSEIETPSVLFISIIIYICMLVFRTALTLPRAHSHSYESVFVFRTALTLPRAHIHSYKSALVFRTALTLPRAHIHSYKCVSVRLFSLYPDHTVSHTSVC